MKKALVWLLAAAAVMCSQPALQAQPTQDQTLLQLCQFDQSKYQLCPNCRTLNYIDSKFCSKCGYNLTSAKPNTAAPAAAETPAVKPGVSRKNPAVSFLLSFFLFPGLGQYYNGEATKGTIQLAGAGAGLILAIMEAPGEEYVPYDYYDSYYDDYYDSGYWKKTGNEALFAIGLSAVAVFKIWSCIDAPLSSSRINRERGFTGQGRPRLLLTVQPARDAERASGPASSGRRLELVSGLEYRF